MTNNTELVFNLWAIFDSSAGLIYGLAGKAYNLSGDDQHKLAVLQALAPTDYVTAKRYGVPERFQVHFSDGTVKKGCAEAHSVGNPVVMLFEDMFSQMEHELPPIPRFDSGQTFSTPQYVPDDPLCVTTILYEDEVGNIRPIVSKEDKDWFSQKVNR